MDIAYKIIFAVGILYSFTSILINGISGAFHLGSHIGHIDGAGHGDGGMTDHAGGVNHHGAHVNHDSSTHNIFPSWFSIIINPLVAVSFLTVFGGIGILGTEYFKWLGILVFVVSLFSGVMVSFLLYRYIAIPLYKSENSTEVSREELVSMPAEVISPILENGFGEIMYTVNSIRYNAPAKHIEGKAVAQGKKVAICKIENCVFYVSEIEGI